MSSSQAPTEPAGRAGRVAVVGATGYVGTYLVPDLLDRGLQVRAVGRSAKVLQARGWQGAEIVEADVLRPETLSAALDGVDSVYYLVHSMAAGSRFVELDREAARNMGQACRAAGVKRIVYLGGLIPEGADSEHLLSRQETGRLLAASGVDVVELRAGIIVGAGSAAYEVMRDLVFNLPLMLTPRWVQSKSSPIALANLLVYLAEALRLPPGIYDAGGPETLSYEAMMREFGATVGRRPRILRVPVLTPTLSSYWLGLVTSVPAPIGRALIGGLKSDIPANDAALRRLVPQRLLNFREAVTAALEAERGHQVAGRWTEGAFPFRAFRHDYAYYAKRATGSSSGPASPAQVWAVLCTLGGDTRYFTMNFLWWLREALDWLVGGPGFTHGRRHPTELRLGDAVDYWTVVGIEPERRLTLNFGMRAPGAGVLEFELEPLPDGGTRLTETAYWHPQGVWGLLYWYALAPAHLFIFRRMTRAILHRAAAQRG
jgi:uncharacterized protein YbjT (DUF2867 family)